MDNMKQTNQKLNRTLPLVGSTEWISVGRYSDVPAKVDTGAESSAIWATNIRVKPDGTLKFTLFGEKSPLYTGRVFTRTPGNYKVGIVRSSNGHEQIRFRVYFRVKIAGKTIRALFSLADRSHNNYPVLVGRRTVAGKFLVDTSQKNVDGLPQDPKDARERSLGVELQQNPYTFYRKYVKTK